VQIERIAGLTNTNYRVTVNNFLADGGDNFVVLREGKDRLFGELDIDAFEKYLAKNAPVASPAMTRITGLNIPAPSPAPAPAQAVPTQAAVAPKTGTAGEAGAQEPAASVLALLLTLTAAAVIGGRALVPRRSR